MVQASPGPGYPGNDVGYPSWASFGEILPLLLFHIKVRVRTNSEKMVRELIFLF
jgi:hypothetical protein